MALDSERFPRFRQFLIIAAAVSGILTILCGCLSYGLAAGSSSGSSSDEWSFRHNLPAILFDVGGLMILDDPQCPLDIPKRQPQTGCPTTTSPWVVCSFKFARVTGLLTSAFGIPFLVLSLFGQGFEYLWLRWIGLRARMGEPLVLICGLGRLGRQLVGDLTDPARRPRHWVNAIESDPAAHSIRESLERGATVIVNDARESSVRRQAGLAVATGVFVVTGSDAVNLDIAEDIRNQLERVDRTKPLDCYVNVLDHTLLLAAETSLTSNETVRFHVFNSDVDAARQLLLDKKWGLARTNGPSGSPSSPIDIAHYFVFGFGSVGQMVALQMARLAHFPNLKRLRLSIVDRFETDAGLRLRRDEFLDRYPGFGPADLNLVKYLKEQFQSGKDPDAWSTRGTRPSEVWQSQNPIAVEYAVNAEYLDLKTGIDAPLMRQDLLARLRPEYGRHPSSVGFVVCFEDEERNFESAIRLRAALIDLAADHGLPEGRLPIYAYIPNEKGLWDLLARENTHPNYPIVPFGRREIVSSYERITRQEIRELARRIHEFYQKMFVPAEWKSFDALDPTLRASNEDAAAHGDIKLDALAWSRRLAPDAPRPEFSPDPAQVRLLAQMEHNRWMGERLCSGWRYGANPQKEGKRRDTFCAWESLTDKDERAKDESHVRALVDMYYGIGYTVEKGPGPAE